MPYMPRTAPSGYGRARLLRLKLGGYTVPRSRNPLLNSQQIRALQKRVPYGRRTRR